MKDCTNLELIQALENYCYAYCHNPTKSNAKAIDTLEAELLRRLDEK